MSYLHEPELYNICLIHSHLRPIAEIYLYSTITFNRLGIQPRPLIVLLQSILRRPKLGTYIREIELDAASGMPGWAGTKFINIPVSEITLKEVLAFVSKTDVSYRTTWLKQLRNGSFDAFFAVLLCQTPHLTSLAIFADFKRGNQLVGSVLRSTLCQTDDCGLGLDFKHLKLVCVYNFVDSKYYMKKRNTKDILTLFYLPSITELRISMDTPDFPSQPVLPWPTVRPPSCPTLRRLSIAWLREPFLKELLSQTNQLQYLSWTWYYLVGIEGDDNTPVVDLPQFLTAISHLHNTLEELIIGTDCIDRANIFRVTILGSLEAISNFNTLRRLNVPLAVLLGLTVDTTKQIRASIPRNLEVLTISDYLCERPEFEWEDNEVLSVLKPWLENVKVSSPFLRTIELMITLPPMGPKWTQPMRDELGELCIRAGIKLVIYIVSVY